MGRFPDGSLGRLFIDSDSGLTDRLELFIELLGWPLLLLAAIGLAARRAPIIKERDSTVWVAHAGLLAGGLFVLLVAPESREVRHLYQLSPSLLLFAAAGAWALTRRLQGSLRWPAAAILGLSCVLLSPTTFANRAKASLAPFDPRSVARYLASEPDAQIILVSTNGRTSEGPLIAEMALLEPLPKRFLVRSSKTIYWIGWNANGYRPVFSKSRDLEKFIDSSGIDTIVRLTGRPQPRRPDEAMLSLVIASRPNDWAAVPMADDVRVHRRITANNTARQPIRIQVASTLGEDLLFEPADPVPFESPR